MKTDYKKKHFKETKLTPTHKSTSLKAGDVVEWENSYGIKFQHTILGFNDQLEYNKKYVHLDKNNYWFPHSADSLKKIN